MKEDYEVTNQAGKYGVKVSFGIVKAISEENAIDIVHSRQVLMEDAAWPKSILCAKKL